MREPTLDGRRAFLIKMMAAGGAALSPALVGAVLAEPIPVRLGPGQAGQALSAVQVAFVDRVSDLIIPRTDTPGASDAGVVGFIDRWLAEYEDEPGRRGFLDGLNEFMQRADGVAGGAFLDLDAETQTGFLLKEDAAAFSGDGPFFRQLKQLVTLGYYSSEPGATLELEYLPVPGPFQGDVPVTEATRNYAT